MSVLNQFYKSLILQGVRDFMAAEASGDLTQLILV